MKICWILVFGNAIRGPLGIHRAVRRRFWFSSADYRLEAQLEYLSSLRKITEEEITRFVAGLTMPAEFQPRSKAVLPPYDPNRLEFRILDPETKAPVKVTPTPFRELLDQMSIMRTAGARPKRR